MSRNSQETGEISQIGSGGLHGAMLNRTHHCIKTRACNRARDRHYRFDPARAAHREDH
jgi:hypothetical protein